MMAGQDKADARSRASRAVVDCELLYLSSDGKTDWANPAKMSEAERNSTQWIGVGLGAARFRTRRFDEPGFRPLTRMDDGNRRGVYVELASVYADFAQAAP